MGLGWLRFVLSLIVVDFHYAFFSGQVQPWLVDKLGVDYLAYAGGGNIAVSGFFVISGYVIAAALSEKYAPTWRGIAAFYTGRALRIYPLYLLVFTAYWLVLAVTASVQAAPHGSTAEVVRNLLLFPLPEHFSANVLLFPFGISGFFADHGGQGPLFQNFFIGPAWTLAYDLIFYAAAPWLVTRKTRLWLVWASGLAYYLAFSTYLDPRQPVWEWYFATSGMPLLFAFTSGALLYHYRMLQPGRATMAAAAVILLLIGYLPLGLGNVTLNLLLAVAAFAVLVAGLRGRSRLDQRLGDLTYATYLLHLPVAQVMAQLGLIGDSMLPALPVTFVLSLAAVYGVEYPLNRLRARLSQRLQHDSGDRASGAVMPWDKPAAISLIALMLIGSAASVRANLLHGGTDVHLSPTALPAGWTWRVAQESTVVTPHGAGQSILTLPAAYNEAHRVLLSIRNAGDSGAAYAGMESGAMAFGIERHGDRCDLVVAIGNAHAHNPNGWSQNCAVKHSFLVSASAGHTNLRVDGIWEFGGTMPPGALRAVVWESLAGQGAVTFGPVFVWEEQAGR